VDREKNRRLDLNFIKPVMNASSSTVPAGMLHMITRVRWRRRLLEGAALGLSAGAFLIALIAAAMALDWQFAWTGPALRWLPSLMALVIGCVALGLLARRLMSRRPLRDEARDIDRTIPALEERWCTVTELSGTKRDPALKGSPELIEKVVAEASAFERQVHPEAIVTADSLRWPAILCLSAVVIFGISAFSVAGNLGTLMHRFFVPWDDVTLTHLETATTPQRVVRQSPLEINASLAGRLPKTASLVLQDQHGATRTIQLTVQKEIIGGVIAHRVPNVDEPFSYQIRAGDAVSPWVPVQPVDRPRLGQFALRLEWPAYTKRPVTTWNDLPASIHALRGCNFEMEFSSDQPLVKTALEVSKQPKAVQLPLESIDSQRYRFATELKEVFHFQILAENEFGLRNSSAECRIDVFDDQPPEVKVLESSQQYALNPDETLRIDFEAKDDFGVNSAEIVAITKKEGEAAQETVIPIELGKEAGATSLKKSVDLDLQRLPLDEKTQLSYAIRVRDNRNEAMSAMPSKGTEAAKTAANSQQPPENEMTKRTLDVAGQSCSAPKNVQIEKYSGTYDGAARDKKSIAIDAVLQGLRKAAKEALTHTEGAASGLAETDAIDVPRAARVRSGLAQTEEGKRLADNLKKESEGTPYAFFAVQTDGLVKGGLDPAAGKLRNVLAGSPAKQNLDDAAVSLRWVIATLDELTKQYVSLKEVQKAEDLLQQIKEMHLVFLEDMPKWLKAGAAGSPYSRKMLEVDAAFAKAYEEFLRKRRDVYMQLAELLAKHPELQARFIEASKTSTTFFRDELMRLKGEQESLASLTKSTGNEPGAVELWQARIQQLQSNVAKQGAQFAKAAATWMPADYAPELKAELETDANEVSKAALRGTGTAEITKALEQLDTFEDIIAKAGKANGRNSAYVRNRFEDIDTLRKSLEQTRQLVQFIDEKKFGDALDAAQSALNLETRSAASKIQQEAIGLIGLGAEVHEAVKKFDDVFQQGVTTPQSRAIEALRAKTYPPAIQSQGTAAVGLERSVEALDDFVQKAIRRMDEANAKRGAGSPPSAPPSLEALLQSLEEEKRSAMCLGICCQPLNIQVQTDWQQPGAGGAAAAAAMAMQQKRAEAARASAEAAAREAAKAQGQANQRAKEMSRKLETALVSSTAPGTAKGPSDKNDWNTVPSALRASLLQERGASPPKRYENAIRQYFKSIAETPAPSATDIPENPRKDQ
jgi:hypothetical protein